MSSTLPMFARVGVGGGGGGRRGFLQTYLEDHLVDAAVPSDMEFYDEEEKKVPVDGPNNSNNNNSVLTLSVSTPKDDHRLFEELISLVPEPEDSQPKVSSPSLLTLQPTATTRSRPGLTAAVPPFQAFSTSRSVRIGDTAVRAPSAALLTTLNPTTIATGGGHLVRSGQQYLDQTAATVTGRSADPRFATGGRGGGVCDRSAHNVRGGQIAERGGSGMLNTARVRNQFAEAPQFAELNVNVAAQQAEPQKANQKKLFYSSLGFPSVPGLSRTGERRSSTSPSGGRSSTSPSSSGRMSTSPPQRLSSSPSWRTSSASNPRQIHHHHSASYSKTSAAAGGSSPQDRISVVSPPHFSSMETPASSSSPPSASSSTNQGSSRPPAPPTWSNSSRGGPARGATHTPSSSASAPASAATAAAAGSRRNPEPGEKFSSSQVKEVLCPLCGENLGAKCILRTCQKSDQVICRRCNMELTTKCILDSCDGGSSGLASGQPTNLYRD